MCQAEVAHVVFPTQQTRQKLKSVECFRQVQTGKPNFVAVSHQMRLENGNGMFNSGDKNSLDQEFAGHLTLLSMNPNQCWWKQSGLETPFVSMICLQVLSCCDKW